MIWMVNFSYRLLFRKLSIVYVFIPPSLRGAWSDVHNSLFPVLTSQTKHCEVGYPERVGVAQSFVVEGSFKPGPSIS